jgi:hypothetical protein
MVVIQRLLRAGVPFSERHAYLRGRGSHRARLNEFTEALSSGSLPMLPLFERYGAQFANFEYQLDEFCFKGSDDEILELFAFLDCKEISASLEIREYAFLSYSSRSFRLALLRFRGTQARPFRTHMASHPSHSTPNFSPIAWRCPLPILEPPCS